MWGMEGFPGCAPGRTGGLLLQNIHLVARWLGKLEKLMEQYSVGSHADYRVFMSAEPAPTPEAHIIPQGLLEDAIKITNEPPTGMFANLHKALDLFTQVPSPVHPATLAARSPPQSRRAQPGLAGCCGSVSSCPSPRLCFHRLSIFGGVTADRDTVPGARPAPGTSSWGCPEPPFVTMRFTGDRSCPRVPDPGS